MVLIGLTSSKFLKNLNYLTAKNSNDIKVYLNSGGGSVCDSFSMYNFAKNSALNLEVYGYGQVCSGATILFQGFKKRNLQADTCFLIHDMSLGLLDKRIPAKKYLISADLSYKRIIDIYTERMVKAPFFKSKSYDQVRTFVKTKISKEQEWYIDPIDCLKLGLCDKIF